MIFGEDISFWMAVILTSIVKIFLTEEEVNENESRSQKVKRIKRSIGGIVAGGMCAYYGYERVIHWSSILQPDDKLIAVIALVITGEQIMRWFMDIGPDKILNMFFSRKK